jgi:GNAT superfamily N-acetyltransferase
VTRARSRASSATPLTEIAVVAVEDADVGLWVELRNRVDPQLPATAEGVHRHRQHEPTARHVLATVDSEPVGVGVAAEQGDLRSTDVAVGFLGVLPEHRWKGVGSALYRALSDHARAIGKARLQVDLWEDEDDALVFLVHRGFEEVERFARVRLDLAAAEIPPAAPPPGVALVPLEGHVQLAGSMYETAVEAFADMPSTDPIEVTFDDFHDWEVDRPSLRADLSILAVVDGEVVGFGTVDFHGDQAFNSLTAVRRAWRRRGVASAIKRAQIEAAKAAGVESLTTFSERRNVPMRTLNERLGYRPLPDQLRLRGPLA